MIPAALVLSGCANEESFKLAGTNGTTKAMHPTSGGEMIFITGGEFTMGDAQGLPDETPHDVSVDSFYIDKYPVSQQLFEKVMGRNPSKRKGAKNPVERVQWTDAARFSLLVSATTGISLAGSPLVRIFGRSRIAFPSGRSPLAASLRARVACVYGVAGNRRNMRIIH